MLTLGTLMHGAELEDYYENKTGLDLIKAKLRSLNYNYCHCTPGKKDLWPIVNRLLWRFYAMYEGGDCMLAEIDRTPEQESQPRDRLWTMGMKLSKNNSNRYIRKRHATGTIFNHTFQIRKDD